MQGHVHLFKSDVYGNMDAVIVMGTNRRIYNEVDEVGCPVHDDDYDADVSRNEFNKFLVLLRSRTTSLRNGTNTLADVMELVSGTTSE
jgi:hypothetical protein